MLISDDGGETFWPPADYLAKVAKADSPGVADVLQALQTARPGTIRQLLNVALNLADEDLISVIRTSTWIQKGKPSFAYLEALINVVERVGTAGALDISFSLARRILGLSSKDPEIPFPGLDRKEASPDIGSDWFQNTLTRLVPILRVLDEQQMLVFLAERLRVAIKIEQDEMLDPLYSGWYDDFLIERERHYGTKRLLAQAFASEIYLWAAKDNTAALLFLEERVSISSIYQRLIYACLVKFPNSAKAYAHLANPDEWKITGPEHLVLVQSAFPAFTDAQRNHIAKIAIDRLTQFVEPFFIKQNLSGDELTTATLRYIGSQFGTAIEFVPEPYRAELIAALPEKPEPPAAIFPGYSELEALATTEVVGLLAKFMTADENTRSSNYGVGGSVNHYSLNTVMIGL